MKLSQETLRAAPLLRVTDLPRTASASSEGIATFYRIDIVNWIQMWKGTHVVLSFY